MTKRKQPRAISDPRAIKALAHPARLAVLDALADGAELTATECATVAGISPSAMSYHLRALEKWGFVQRAASSTDGRERPWRGVPGGWTVDALPNAAAATAASAVVYTMLDRLRGDVAAWFEHERDQPEKWRQVGRVQNTTLWLTADETLELAELRDEWISAKKGRTKADHPDGARRVRFTSVVVPVQFE